jgi:hypothetical protein
LLKFTVPWPKQDKHAPTNSEWRIDLLKPRPFCAARARQLRLHAQQSPALRGAV